MKVFFQKGQKVHNPESFIVMGAVKPNPETPERADRLLAAVQADGHEIVEPDDHGLSVISAIHSPDYIDFLMTIYDRWIAAPNAASQVIPNAHPNRWMPISKTTAPVGLAGYYMADTGCPISKGTWEAVYDSAQSAASATKAVMEGERASYALCRPPGHHAFTDMAGGFCFVNNSGLAAQMLRSQHDRVAILDVDVHHGNGTQGMFYDRSDVLTVSIHRDPIDYYPYFWGHAQETGEGSGTGYNLNVPLPKGTGDDAYMPALHEALTRIARFQPGALVVALGLDAFEGDPLNGLSITTAGFARIAGKIAAVNLPTVLVQEGGYLCDELGANLASFLRGFEGR